MTELVKLKYNELFSGVFKARKKFDLPAIGE